MGGREKHSSVSTSATGLTQFSSTTGVSGGTGTGTGTNSTRPLLESTRSDSNPINTGANIPHSNSYADSPSSTTTPLNASALPLLPYPYPSNTNTYLGYTDDSKYPITLPYPYPYPYTSSGSNGGTPRNGSRPHSMTLSGLGLGAGGGALASAYNAFLEPDLTPLSPMSPGSTPGKLIKTRPYPPTKSNSNTNTNTKSPLGPGQNQNPSHPNNLTNAQILYDLEFNDTPTSKFTGINYRGIFTLGGLLTLITAILTLFVFYPIFSWFHGEAFRSAIVGNARVNGSSPGKKVLPSFSNSSEKTRT